MGISFFSALQGEFSLTPFTLYLITTTFFYFFCPFPSSTQIRAPQGALTGNFKGPIWEANKGPICKMKLGFSRGPREGPASAPYSIFLAFMGLRYTGNIDKGPSRGPQGYLGPRYPANSCVLDRVLLGYLFFKFLRKHSSHLPTSKI